ncbi:MAG TPA: phage minor head protein, partial [Leptospiraceae bacterium]|nr:phage minor head protein [Leptospiraceae bacterium]
MFGTHNLSSGFRAKKGSLSTRISAFRKDGLDPKSGFLKKRAVLYPFALIHQHKKTVETYFRTFAGRLNDSLFPMLEKDIPKYSDSHRSDAEDIYQLLAELRTEYGEWIDQAVLEEKIRQNLHLIDIWTAGQTNQSLSDQYKEIYGSVLAGISSGTAPEMIQVNLNDPAALESLKAAARNQRLAQNELYAKHFQDVEKIISDGIVNGKSKDEITKEILAKVDMNANRAKFWAEDQTAVFESEQTRLRQTRAGVTHYYWITQGTKTRPSHAVHSRKIISWAVGVGNLARPGARHAGQDYRCHCIPDPIYPDKAAELGLSPNSNGSPKDPVPNISGPLSTEELVGNYYQGSGRGVQGSAVSILNAMKMQAGAMIPGTAKEIADADAIITNLKFYNLKEMERNEALMAGSPLEIAAVQDVATGEITFLRGGKNYVNPTGDLTGKIVSHNHPGNTPL